ncbi:DUF4232 domain-containing protein [Streptomyces chiangmaiensis]|uniref:DUF4232 domain-containing protein n=1 Tax=Streptomyces chiangmaiensis TaxID=766497 RepID=A0ABU7FG08_9ACTN|nr:DUF4232 domain-containing protein [Streptomyces chiangmaiensis]MED7822865.1 DUF4232 domain-containing protein [Streptomyces chiangmaiensis]
MRTLHVRLTVTAVAAAMALTACDSESGDDGKDAAACRIAVEVGPGNAATSAGDTGNVPVTLTNRDSKTCTLKGFPGVELRDGDSAWTVADEEGAQPAEVTLQKDETATFTITYVRGNGGSRSAPVKTVKITVPGAGDAGSHPWSYGDVALKGAKTPDATVSPVQVAGD